MTLDEAVAIIKTRSINGRCLRDGLEEVKYLWRTNEDELTEKDKLAYHIVCNNELSKRF